MMVSIRLCFTEREDKEVNQFAGIYTIKSSN